MVKVIKTCNLNISTSQFVNLGAYNADAWYEKILIANIVTNEYKNIVMVCSIVWIKMPGS